MYMRGARVTFTNEMMKKSVVAFMSQTIDLTEGMIVSIRTHLSENQILHIMVFPDEQTAEGFARAAKGYGEQIKEMGAKMEILKGDISHFGIAGDVTLDQLRFLG
tara:strand:+ start:1077 stop:1391 length:315 start_codon:yes stop_codon:yes gene_type:complete